MFLFVFDYTKFFILASAQSPHLFIHYFHLLSGILFLSILFFLILFPYILVFSSFLFLVCFWFLVINSTILQCFSSLSFIPLFPSLV
jgi:hypothetical protein